MLKDTQIHESNPQTTPFAHLTIFRVFAPGCIEGKIINGALTIWCKPIFFTQSEIGCHGSSSEPGDLAVWNPGGGMRSSGQQYWKVRRGCRWERP